jgi:segregation and condensation protein A
MSTAPQVTMLEFKLPVFEGPLDLLIHLIDREELDITTVSLVQVTDQYLAHLRQGDVNAAALADFVAVGARLLFLKSRALLPRGPESRPDEDDGEREDDLTDLLLEYRQLQEVAGYFAEIEERGRRSYPRGPNADKQMPLPLGLGDVTLDALATIFQEALARHSSDSNGTVEVIEREPFTIQDKIKLIKARLRESGRVSFNELMYECRSRTEVIVQFMAVLELIKGQVVRARQQSPFADIVLVPATRRRSTVRARATTT